MIGLWNFAEDLWISLIGLIGPITIGTGKLIK
jgi:hypothetical protein